MPDNPTKDSTISELFRCEDMHLTNRNMKIHIPAGWLIFHMHTLLLSLFEQAHGNELYMRHYLSFKKFVINNHK